MKKWKFLPVMIILGSILLSACVGFSLAPAAPTATNSPTQAIVQPTAQTTPALNPTAQPVAAVSATAQPVIAVPTTGEVQSLQSAYEAIYQQVNPSVVNIQISANQTSGFGFSGRGQTTPSQPVPVAEGSGFVWDTNGHIVTNNHVIDGADLITVTFADGKTADAKLVGADPNSDLAVIQVNVPASELTPVKIASSADVKVGQLTVAIGNPYGLAGSMTTGIVSAISRSIQVGASSNNNQNSLTPSTGNYSIPDIIQTDAAINPGNSGGVLLDMNGSVIGVPSQIESASGSNSGVGFAIPSDIVSKVVPELISNGTYAHSWLGISGSTVTPDLVSLLGLKAGQQGVLVATVVPNGPAAAAKLVAATTDANGNPVGGDIITGIDGKAITRFEDLVSYLFNNTKPGQVVTLTILRSGQEIQVKVTLGTQPTA
jgi:serine protease Do